MQKNHSGILSGFLLRKSKCNNAHKTKNSLQVVTNLSNLHFMRRLISSYGGGGGIRTPAGFDTPVGFQDRSLQPDLGTPPYRQDLIYQMQQCMSTLNCTFFIILEKRI